MSMQASTAAAKGFTAKRARRVRGISLVARGEPMVWLTGGTVALAILMILGLLGFITVMGFTTFWPSPVHRVTFKVPGDSTGRQRTILAEPFRSETYRPVGSPVGTTATRTLYRTGNVDLTGERFVWVNNDSIVSTEIPKDATIVERTGWGNAVGFVAAVLVDGELKSGPEAWPKYQQVHGRLRDAANRKYSIEHNEIGEISRRRRQLSIDRYEAELTHGVQSAAYKALVELQKNQIEGLDRDEAEYKAEIAKLIAEMSAGRIYIRTIDDHIVPAERDKYLLPVLPSKLVAGQKAKARLVDVDDTTAKKVGSESVVTFYPSGKKPRIELVAGNGAVAETVELWPDSRIAVIDGQDVDSSTSLASRANPLELAQVVLAYQPNSHGTGEKMGTYFSKWWEFLSESPREANTEGGVFPAIVGTVLMTFVMIIFVVPLGVIAAIYLREYAKQGFLVTIIRISVNNLAGVPSIVFGVFGLAFFCYGLGRWIDTGPQSPLTNSSWFGLLVVTCVLIVGAFVLSLTAGRAKKSGSARTSSIMKWGVLLWVLSAGAVAWLVSQAPFFKGLYWVEAKMGDPTLGKTAMIWASLTLALLTLPVVIVATEEALSAVPRSMREGSYACGASKWQTIRRIVLPRALPGIMTGTILAVARGAGEVAPIMLVGAVKMAPELPVSLQFPWFGTDRSFMHLGFHIYDVGFQSPDSENARPLVFTTTFLLIAIVMLLNFSAMIIRSRLRRAHATSAF